MCCFILVQKLFMKEFSSEYTLQHNFTDLHRMNMIKYSDGKEYEKPWDRGHQEDFF